MSNEGDAPGKEKKKKAALGMGRQTADRDKEGKGDTARAGATFDPKNFKGNVQLFRHLAEMSVSMSK